MAGSSHLFVNLASLGELEACVAQREELRPVLAAMYARGELRGYRLFVLHDRNEVEDEMLHHMLDYEAVTGGRFPFVYALLTPLDSDDSRHAIDQLMTARGFKRFR